MSTDVGPVIDGAAQTRLRAYADTLGRQHECLAEAPLGENTRNGTFVAPQAYAITMQAIPDHEVFGPILHVIRFDARELDAVVDCINATGYGLTLGIHSRLDSTVEQITRRIRAGNAYVNRNMIGAVVGVQPFGGEGLSGTGPKAGGPRYLHRFALERVVSVNTAAAGGNTDLMRLSDDLSSTPKRIAESGELSPHR